MNKLVIFLWHIVTEPFIQIKTIFTTLLDKGAQLNYPKEWQKIFLILMVFSYLAGNRFLGNIFLILLVSTILKSQWDSGYFMERWRKRLEKKAEKEDIGD